MNKCILCGEPMPSGEEMFQYHGFSNQCKKEFLPETYIDPIRALRIIEGLVSEKSLDDEFAANIYKIAHAGGMPKCNENHPDFVEFALEIEKQLVDDRTIAPWKK